MADNERYYLSHKSVRIKDVVYFFSQWSLLLIVTFRLRITGLNQVMVTFWCAGQKLALWFLVIE